MTDPGGFTFVEVLMVVALIMVATLIAIPVSRTLITRSKASSTNMEVLTWFETARNRATAERRNFEMTFDSASRQITVDRVETNNGRTPIIRRLLPDGVQFYKFTGTPDTPDLFGDATAIDFDGPSPYMFTSDGSFVDANGDPSNGTIFMGKPGQRDTGTAITVFGTTGLLRSWKLSGSKWLK